MKKYIAPLLLCLLLSACVPKQDLLQPNVFQIEEAERPWILAHGGAKKLYPENTMLAFESVQQYAIDALEMDVCITKDDVLVTHHDLTIDRTSDGSGELVSFTYEELLAFNFGENFKNLSDDYPFQDSLIAIGNLSDVMSRYGHLYLNIELKNRGENGMRAAEKLAELISQHGLEDKVLVASFSDEVLDHFLEVSEGKVAISTSEEATKDLVFTGISGADYLYRPHAAAAQIPTKNSGINLGTSRLINACHRRDMAVHYWTIDDTTEMRKLIEMGADGLITDRPDLMEKLLERMGY